MSDVRDPRADLTVQIVTDPEEADQTVDVLGTFTELAWAETAAQQTGIGATPVDVTGLEVEFTVGDRAVLVEAFLPWAFGSAAGDLVGLQITDGADTPVRVGGASVSGANRLVQVRVVERITTPGTYTRKARIVRSAGSGTITNNSGLDTTVAHLRAYVSV